MRIPKEVPLKTHSALDPLRCVVARKRDDRPCRVKLQPRTSNMPHTPFRACLRRPPPHVERPVGRHVVVRISPRWIVHLFRDCGAQFTVAVEEFFRRIFFRVFNGWTYELPYNFGKLCLRQRVLCFTPCASCGVCVTRGQRENVLDLRPACPRPADRRLRSA